MSNPVDTFLKRYFRIIAKPIALTIMFFAIVVLLYFSIIIGDLLMLFVPYFWYPPQRRIWEQLTMERFESLGSFMNSLFQGNFGISYLTHRPVSEELVLRLPFTLTLIGFSVVLSIVTGFVISSIALKWKPSKRRPITFSHLLKGLFFGLTPLIGILLLFVFYVNLRWFPAAGAFPCEWAGRYPTDLWEVINGRLRHLFLPLFTLTLVFLVKNLWKLWSSGPFSSKNTLKRFLLPIATLDFPFIVSAVLLTEIVFTYPGVGSLLWDSIMFLDYNVVLGAFIFLLALTVILGYLSTVLDLINRLSGIHQELEEPVTSKSSTNNKQLKGEKSKSTKHLFRCIIRKKRFIIGSALVTFFIMTGALAPFLTSYNVLGEDPSTPLFPLGAANVAPVWLRHLPEWLGGNPSLSEHMLVVKNPGLPKPASEEGEWNVMMEGSGVSDPIIRTAVGFPLQAPQGFTQFTQNGSLEIKFSRPKGTFYNGTKIRLYVVFDYPYTGPPGRFFGNIELLVNGSTYQVEETVFREGRWVTEYINYLDVPIVVKVYMGQQGGREWKLWPCPYVPYLNLYPPKGFATDPVTRQPWGIDKLKSGLTATDGWIIARDSPATKSGHIDSQSNYLVNDFTEFGMESFPHRMIFTDPGTYVYGIEITFLDQEDSTKDVFTEVFIDDFGLQLYGSSFGLLGTDHHGRDLYSQVLCGTIVMIISVFPIAALAILIGFPLGFIAGHFKGWVDNIIMTFVDTVLYIPVLPFFLVVVALFAIWSSQTLLVWILLFSALSTLAFRNSYILHPSKQNPEKTIQKNRVLRLTKDAIANFCLLVVSITLLLSSIEFFGLWNPYVISWGRVLYSIIEASALTNWWWFGASIVCITLFALGFFLLGSALDED